MHPESAKANSPLHEQGVRITGPRRAVLDAISTIDGPFTVEDVCAATPEVGRATVFRTVKLLQEAGAICRLALDDGGVRYQVSRGGHHHHLICNSCGAVDDFSDADLDALIDRNARARGFELSGHSLELYGHCAACALSENESGTASLRRA